MGDAWLSATNPFQGSCRHGMWPRNTAACFQEEDLARLFPVAFIHCRHLSATSAHLAAVMEHMQHQHTMLLVFPSTVGNIQQHLLSMAPHLGTTLHARHEATHWILVSWTPNALSASLPIARCGSQ